LAEARKIAPLVTTSWLAKNADEPGLIIVDIRPEEEYSQGHIPGAVNAPFASWAVTRGQLIVELPDPDELFGVIGAAGIDTDSRVVIVNKTDSLNNRADAARVACTLFYAGVKNAAVLDGGHNKWRQEARPISQEAVRPRPKAYRGQLDKGLFVNKEYVKKRLGQTTIVDARDPSDYFGATQDPYSSRPGHIPTAVSLPMPWVWTEAGTHKSLEELRAMAAGVIGEDKGKEIIIYCGAGGFASNWCFVLRELLGYTDIKIYDGAAQEWTSDPKAPVVKYSWS
jgi:thiosulfate/3-mercaptopyruvate sulfurtransferase